MLGPRSPRLLRTIVAAALSPVTGGAGECPCCDARVPGFLPYRFGRFSQAPSMRAHAVAGSDPVRFACPRCGASDRDRHLLLYLRATGDLARCAGTVLHFAPEAALVPHVLARQPAQYLRADLFPTSPEILRVDIGAIPLRDSSVDVAIANHVLEHVGDVDLALRELHRVLRPDGIAILQTPFATALATTIEGDPRDDARTRFLRFGQEDHVRLFGRDLVARVVAAGFVDCTRTHAQALADVDARRFGVSANEPYLRFARG